MWDRLRISPAQAQQNTYQTVVGEVPAPLCWAPFPKRYLHLDDTHKDFPASFQREGAVSQAVDLNYQDQQIKSLKNGNFTLGVSTP